MKRAKNHAIAVIGIACRFPGARNYQEYWANLLIGRNSVSEIPADRFRWQDFYGDPQNEINKSNANGVGLSRMLTNSTPCFSVFPHKKRIISTPNSA